MFAGAQASRVQCDICSGYVLHERDHVRSDGLVVLIEYEMVIVIINVQIQHKGIIISTREHDGMVIDFIGWHILTCPLMIKLEMMMIIQVVYKK